VRSNPNVAALLANLCADTDDPDVFRDQIYDIAAVVAHLLTGRAGEIHETVKHGSVPDAA
jgi:hypothetical protein